MKLLKLFLLSSVLLLSVAMSGCQGNNSDTTEGESDTNSTIPPPSGDVNQTVTKLTIVNGNSITVTGSGEVKTVNVVGFNANSSMDVVGEVTFQYPSDSLNGVDLGYITPSKLKLVNGLAQFEYKAPDNLKAREDAGYTGATFKFYEVENPSVSIDLRVDFNSSSSYTTTPPVLKTLILSEKELTLKINSETKSLNILAFTDQGTTDIDTTIKVKYPADVISAGIDIGYINPTINIVEGKAVFNYEAPQNIEKTVADLQSKGLGHSVVVKFYNTDSGIETFLTLNFLTSSIDPKYSNYKLTVVDENRTIAKAGEIQNFEIYLSDTNSSTPVSGERINLTFFDGSKGSIDSFSATTDDRGKATFIYTAPSDLKDLNNTTLEFKLDNDLTKVTTATLYVSSQVTQKPILTVDAIDSKITLSKNGEHVKVIIKAFNNNNEPFNSGKIIVRYPADIVNGTVSGGSFLQSEVAIVNGEAVFDFVGPDPLKSSPALNFTFVYSEDSATSTVLSVNYIPDVPKIVFNDSNITITKNGEVRAISMIVYDKDNAYYPDGYVSIKYPDSVLSGKNVGSFDSSSVSLVNGKATFTYTAPNPLDGNESILFTFYHSAQPLLSEADLNISIVPDAGQIVLTNYTLDAIYETSMDLNISKQMTYFVSDDQGNKVADSNMSSITVKILNTALGSLEDSDGNTGTTLSVNNKNNVQMNIKTKTLSGILPIQVDTVFKDVNNKEQNLTRVFNIVVLSGPPTAASLSYAGTTQKSESAKFIENWVLTVTDKYNNLVNTTPAISMGMVTGYTTSSATTANVANYLYYSASVNDGNLTNTNPDTFKSSKNVFDNVDLVNDKLILFGGNGYLFGTYGKWDIDSFSSNELTLKDDYNGTDKTGLSYAVGHNFRNEWCSNDPVVSNVYGKDNNNTLGTTGSMIIQVEYDYYLVGKSVLLWANFVGENNNTAGKIGIAKKVTLRGNGLTGESYSYAKGFEGVVRLSVHITDTVEYYKNANFGYRVEVTGNDTNWTISGSSMQDGNITNCSLNSGVAYVDVNITSEAGSAGTIKLINVLPSDEF